jgi:hypothetical protein
MGSSTSALVQTGQHRPVSRHASLAQRDAAGIERDGGVRGLMRVNADRDHLRSSTSNEWTPRRAT